MAPVVESVDGGACVDADVGAGGDAVLVAGTAMEWEQVATRMLRIDPETDCPILCAADLLGLEGSKGGLAEASLVDSNQPRW